MSMQTDAEFQKEQNGTLFVWVGALGGGYWGGGGSRAPKPKNRVDVQFIFFGASCVYVPFKMYQCFANLGGG